MIEKRVENERHGVVRREVGVPLERMNRDPLRLGVGANEPEEHGLGIDQDPDGRSVLRRLARPRRLLREFERGSGLPGGFRQRPVENDRPRSGLRRE